MAKRTNQTDRTRQAIVDAASDIFLEASSPEEFTMQNVADAAGVSHRTLYRYFDSRRALVNAVGASYDERMDASVGVEVLESFDAWVSVVPKIVAFGATHADILRRAIALSVTTGEWRSDRDDAYWVLFRETFPNLDESIARQDFAVFRHVLWSTNALLIGQRFDLTIDGVTSGIERSVAALVADIERRDSEAQAREEGS